MKQLVNLTIFLLLILFAAKLSSAVRKHGQALEEVEVVEKDKVQQPRLFYRREYDVQPLIVARP